MSWFIRIAGKDREALKQRVIAERTPPAVQEELLHRIGTIPLAQGQIISVFSTGHVTRKEDHAAARGTPYEGSETLVFQVYAVPFLDTPVETAADVAGNAVAGKVGDGG